MADTSFESIAAAIRDLSRKKVLIGIPGEGDPRPDSTFGNVSRGYVFEFGSPATNMPPRPHLVPGVEAAMPEIVSRLEAAGRAVANGADPDPYLHQAGTAGMNAVVQKIDDVLKPPITPLSYLNRQTGRLARGYRRRRARRGETGPLIYAPVIEEEVYAQAEAEAATATPLVDTGAYRRSITYVIRNT